MKRFWLIILALICLYPNTSFSKEKAQFIKAKTGNQSYYLEIADTLSKRTQGLSDRNKLDKNQGMLFIFSSISKHSFWMKNMQFPLDFIWLKDNKVVAIKENVSNSNQIFSFSAAKPFNRVIELNAGEISKNKIKPGNLVHFIGKTQKQGSAISSN